MVRETQISKIVIVASERVQTRKHRIGDYLAKYVATDALIIVMGDHQPNLQLTGTDEPWSVPMHVISRNPRLLDPFRKRGYTPGLIPAQPLPHAGMETFLQGFLEDFE